MTQFVAPRLVGDGASPIASAVINFFSVDVHAVGFVLLPSGGVFDNVSDLNPVADDLPPEMGLSFRLGESAMTVLEDGVWAFTFYAMPGAADTDLVAQVALAFTAIGRRFRAPQGFRSGVVMTETIALPAGAAAAYSITTVVAPTTNPYYVVSLLSIVRLR